MKTSLVAYRAEVTSAALDFIVDQWRKLGSTSGLPHEAGFAVDPEVLIALTTSLGRHDSRVFDGMIDWLVCNGQWINVQRLGRITAEDGIADPAALGATAAWLAARDRSMKWRRLASALRPTRRVVAEPLFVHSAASGRGRQHDDGVFAAYGLSRAPFVLRGQARPVRLRSPAAILCTSRAVFGVAVRADVMAFLTVNDQIHPRGLAAALGYNHMQVRTVLLGLEQAGIATAHSSSRTRQYAIDREIWRPVLCDRESTVEWVDWRRLASGIHGIVSGLWAINAHRADETVAESLVRDVIRASRDSLLMAHPQAANPRGLSRIIGSTLAELLRQS